MNLILFLQEEMRKVRLQRSEDLPKVMLQNWNLNLNLFKLQDQCFSPTCISWVSFSYEK